jgi:transposase
MRFVPVKSADQQSVLMLHRVRALLIRQRTMLVNALRAHLAEFGVVVAQGVKRIRELIAMLTGENAPVPALARTSLAPLVEQLDPPPSKWSTLRYVFGQKEDHHAEEAPQAGRDRRQVEAGRRDGVARPAGC